MTRSRKATAIVEFSLGSAREAEAVRKALMPEESLPPQAHCRASVRCRKNVLCLRVDAIDTASLRAALNSFVRWVTVARDMIHNEGR